MPEARGHIELERTVDSIVVGARHRKDPGDIEALAASIEQLGLLQPITITPDGVLVCGLRRLLAVRRLGWRTLAVWVRSGISDELSGLLAQRDENELAKPLNELEKAALYRELKALISEEASRRQEVTRFGADEGLGAVSGAVNGEVNSAIHGAAPGAAPRGQGDARRQAAQAITGKASYSTHERVNELTDIAARPTVAAEVKSMAREALQHIQDGEPVRPWYDKVTAALALSTVPQPGQRADSTDSSLDRLAADALARVQQDKARSGVRALQNRPTGKAPYRSLRSFILTWTELEGWSQLYDADELARSLHEEEWDRFERVVAESVDFAGRVREARHALTSA